MASVAEKRQLVTRSVSEKYKAIKDLERGMTKMDVQQKYAVNRNTLNSWLKSKEKIVTSIEAGSFKGAANKRIKASEFPDLEEALIQWLRDARAKNIPVHGPLVKEKANQLAEKLGHTSFGCSEGWLQRFKMRHSLVFRTIRGEAKSVTAESVSPWFETRLPDLLRTYYPKDIYNADETSFFYKTGADRSLVFPDDDCRGVKKSKLRVTVMPCANMDGSDRLPLLVIGHSQKPRCFRNSPRLPVEYFWNKKAWMTSTIFTSWVVEFNSRMATAGRHIIPVVDNCPAHPHQVLSNVTLVYLPPNTTSKTQPMDQGIIQALKARYRSFLAKKKLNAMDHNVEFEWNLLKAVEGIHKCWREISSSTISNCFAHCGFKTEERATEDEVDPLEDVPLSELAHRLHIKNGTTEEQVRDFLLVSDADGSCYAPVTDDTIVQEVRKKFSGHDEEADDDGCEPDDEQPPPQVSIAQMMTFCEGARNFARTTPGAYEIIDLADRMENIALKTYQGRLKQACITSFFTPTTSAAE